MCASISALLERVMVVCTTALHSVTSMANNSLTPTLWSYRYCVRLIHSPTRHTPPHVTLLYTPPHSFTCHTPPYSTLLHMSHLCVGLPYFTYQPQPTEVTVGDTATLLCGGRGVPVAMVTWFMKENDTSRIVNPDLRHIITDHALLIQRAESADEGHYFCTISSPLMTRTSPTAHLRVYSEWACVWVCVCGCEVLFMQDHPLYWAVLWLLLECLWDQVR